MRAEDFRSFSKKQLTLLNWWCESSPYKSRDAIICDGAVLTGEITESTKAGDITVSQSPSLRLEWAANMRDEALLAAYPLLKDSDFVFEQVKYEGA